MGVDAIRARPGIEMELAAAKPARLLDHPVDELARMPFASVRGQSSEVVAVEGVTPEEVVHDTETRRRDGMDVSFDEGSDQPVTPGPLHSIDALDESCLVAHGRP